MRTPSSPVAIAFTVLAVAACFAERPDDAGQNDEDVAAAIDMATYVVPTCGSAGEAWQIGGEQFRVVPMGMQGASGRFVIVKGTDGSGYEEWSIDKDWLRIRTDTTWAYELPDHTWCDVKCGTNDGSNCQQRWNTNPNDPRNGLRPSSPWVYTVYGDAQNANVAAPWIPRKLNLAMNATTQYTSHMIIEGATKDGCSACAVNFGSNGRSVGRTVKATRLPSWNGFQDVVELTVLSGPGAGEVYDYARGQGWIGFNGKFASARVQSGALPTSSCAGFHEGSICQATSGNAAPTPTPTPTPTPAASSPPRSGTCACSHTQDNFCLYAANTPGCEMTARGGYCDPNSDGNTGDADWVRGFNEYRERCR